MVEQKVRLVYPSTLINQPLIYHLIQKFGLYTNIIEAQVTPQEGRLVVILRGSQHALHAGLEWIAGEGVQVERLGASTEVD
jgi:L-aspartate semialdehyde sulfurtransferase ferredoxin